MVRVYLALYKGRANHWKERLEDRLIRTLTRGKYSHCEIAIKKCQVTDHYDYEEWFECYSSSPRDGGVRCKIIDVGNADKWDLIELNGITESQIRFYFELTQGKQYDLWGALGVVLGFAERGHKFFCSEWCFNALFKSNQGWRFSPNDLVEIINISKELK